MAKDQGHEFGFPLSEREIFLVKHEKEEVGPLRWNVVKYGWPRDTHHVIFFAIARSVAVWE